MCFKNLPIELDQYGKMHLRPDAIDAFGVSENPRINGPRPLADGHIRESGTHEELVLRRGLYWRLYNLQFQDVNS